MPKKRKEQPQRGKKKSLGCKKMKKEPKKQKITKMKIQMRKCLQIMAEFL